MNQVREGDWFAARLCIPKLCFCACVVVKERDNMAVSTCKSRRYSSPWPYFLIMIIRCWLVGKIKAQLSLYLLMYQGRAIVQAVSRRLPTAAARIRPRSGHVGFVVDKVVLGQVFDEYFGFPCQFSFLLLFHNHHNVSSWAGIIGQTVAAVPSWLSHVLGAEV
jgi:hypothetical protein